AGRTAAWRREERRGRNRLPVQLWQSVDRVGEPGQVDVRRLVPRDVVVRVVQTVVGRQVDRPATVTAHDRHRLLRLHVGQREEHVEGETVDTIGEQVVE